MSKGCPRRKCQRLQALRWMSLGLEGDEGVKFVGLVK